MAQTPCISTVHGFTNDTSPNQTMNDIFAPLEDIHFDAQFSTLLELSYQDSQSLKNTQSPLPSRWANRTIFISSATTSTDGCVDASSLPSHGTKHDPTLRSVEDQDRQNTEFESLGSLSATGDSHAQLREEIYRWLALTEDSPRLSYARPSEPEESDSRTCPTPFRRGVESPSDSRGSSARSHSSTEDRSQGEASGEEDSQPVEKSIPQRFHDGYHAALLQMLPPSSVYSRGTHPSFHRQYRNKEELAFYEGL
ncbi:hypothetical protein BGZ61DRAFT_475375 [Ilyonectria robusta]|uniref:uncharacterized protein n=1 Tax=Ilyonectria robusta TaxID=1079257 RepID=UPI001E8C9E3B|nr:uncharacterized protein BGZ61DRAFT_475375 [Ilyonectria robusta]KAH8729809.1 hypothetical protein BGZ61DRAFT_475375 [Ilyonectria robusta]